MDQLRRKVGPFEIWQWLLIVVIGIGIGILIRKRLGSGSSAIGTGGESEDGVPQTVGASPGYSGVGGGGGMGPQPSPDGNQNGSRSSSGPSGVDSETLLRDPAGLRNWLGTGDSSPPKRTQPITLPADPEPANVAPIRNVTEAAKPIAYDVTSARGTVRYKLDPDSGQYLAPSGARLVPSLHTDKTITPVY